MILSGTGSTTVPVNIVEDEQFENEESFSASLSPTLPPLHPRITLLPSVAQATIIDEIGW